MAASTASARGLLGGGAVLLGSLILALGVGAVSVPWTSILHDSVALVTGGDQRLTDTQAAIIWQLRLPRIALAALVGTMLAAAGCAYQGTFRNPLADPYLLGVSAGAGLGATAAIVAGSGSHTWLLPLAAFVGSMVAVTLTYTLGRSALVGRSATSLVLAGVAVAAMLTALQTLLTQRHPDRIREVYGWVLGRLATAGWSDVQLVAPYVLVCVAVLVRYRRVLDVFAVGDEEAATLGLPVARARGAVIAAASLGTAAAVAVTGLIGFVGIIVPHIVRLFAGGSYRRLLPYSALYGGAFLVLADVLARTALAPQEIPIGVVTALIGAPFFLTVLASSRMGSAT